MDQTLRRVIALVSAVVVFGCSSDDATTTDEITEDASVDSGPDDTPPAATSGSGGRGGRGGSGAGGAGGDEAPKSCDDLECSEPATCEETDGEARCVCPDGYDDPNGDGTECKDKDECASEDDNDCDRNATCENTPGGYECKCKAPAYEGDGKSCSCADGYTEQEGFCVGDDGEKCEDDLDCANGNCEGGTCCAVACNSPDGECKTAEGATCSDGKTCVYPVAEDGATCDDGNACLSGSTCKAGECIVGADPVSCDDNNPCTDDSCDEATGCRNRNNTASCNDDNPCTQTDVCAAGVCTGSNLRDCSASADACNTGTCDPATGECGKTPVENGTACNDQNTCTLMDRCSDGTCTGGNACGPNASACSPGSPNDCTCNPNYLEEAGRCVPENNECDANPCSADATCFDPSNEPNDVTCTCNEGFEGNGRTCVLAEPCADNPCGEGRGTCAETTPGNYSCSCAAGFVASGGTCVCDLSGTFAVRAAYALEWSDLDGIEDGSATSYSWSIVRFDYMDDGALEMAAVACGDSEVDLCSDGSALLGREAYAQYGDLSSAGGASSVVNRTEFELETALPGESFTTPDFAMLAGITLANPLGEWPGGRRAIQGSTDFSGTATNGARWLDSDGDSYIGVTTYAVGPGGVTASTPGPRPLNEYGPTSPVCPRSNPSAERYPYNYPPAADGLLLRRVKRFYSANRVVQSYRGMLNSCDEIAGDVLGPNGQQGLRVDGVIGGCVRDNNGGDAACSGSLLDFLEGPEQGQDVESGAFVMRRAANDITCADVRAFDFE